MKLRVSIIGLGIVVLVLGVIFHLQGQGIVGPESSFMYTNPQWITYGMQIAILGMVICGIGIALVLLKRTRQLREGSK